MYRRVRQKGASVDLEQCELLAERKLAEVLEMFEVSDHALWTDLSRSARVQVSEGDKRVIAVWILAFSDEDVCSLRRLNDVGYQGDVERVNVLLVAPLGIQGNEGVFLSIQRIELIFDSHESGVERQELVLVIYHHGGTLSASGY